MRWFSFTSLKALVQEMKARESSNMQAVNNTFSEVYENMETLDGRIDALEHKTDAAYLERKLYGVCSCIVGLKYKIAPPVYFYYVLAAIICLMYLVLCLYQLSCLLALEILAIPH